MITAKPLNKFIKFYFIWTLLENILAVFKITLCVSRKKRINLLNSFCFRISIHTVITKISADVVKTANK